LEPVCAPDAVDRHNATLGKDAPAKRSLIELGDAVDSVKDAGQATARDPAGREHAGTRSIERVRIVGALCVDLSVNPPPPSATLTPSQGFPRQPASGRFLGCEQPSHPGAPAFDAPGWW
jgi:hypothetical protein